MDGKRHKGGNHTELENAVGGEYMIHGFLVLPGLYLAFVIVMIQRLLGIL